VDAASLLIQINKAKHYSSDMTLRGLNLFKGFRVNCGDNIAVNLKNLNFYLWLMEEYYTYLTDGWSGSDDYGMDDDDITTIVERIKELFIRYRFCISYP